MVEERRQDFNLVNQNQVVDRTGVGYDDHPARRSPGNSPWRSVRTLIRDLARYVAIVFEVFVGIGQESTVLLQEPVDLHEGFETE